MIVVLVLMLSPWCRAFIVTDVTHVHPVDAPRSGKVAWHEPIARLERSG
jgi:hypothetical protein